MHKRRHDSNELEMDMGILPETMMTGDAVVVAAVSFPCPFTRNEGIGTWICLPQMLLQPSPPCWPFSSPS